MTGEAQPLTGEELNEWMAFEELRNEFSAKRSAHRAMVQDRLSRLPGRR